MIRLEVEGYCQECLDFKPDVIPARKQPRDWEPGFELSDTVIYCDKRYRCANIRAYLERQMKGEEKG